MLRLLDLNHTIRMAAVVCALSLCGAVSAASSLEDNYERAAAAMMAAEETLIDFRHDLHRHPELSGQERRTSSKVVAQLKALGYDVRTEVGGYGVVGVLEGAADGPILAFRADMDATSQEALDDVPYASEVEGVHHICGHDVHATIGVGLAVGFAAIRDELPGTIMLIFQPSEEAGTGANAMLADDLFAEHKPDGILAVHTYPLNVGQLATIPGGMLAGRSLVSVKLTGNGDLKEASNRVRTAINGVATVKPENFVKPAAPGFIAVDLFAGPAQPIDNVLTVQGYVMSAGLDRRALTKAAVLDSLDALTFDGIDIEVSYEQVLEGVNNDPSMIATASAGINSLVADVEILPALDVFPAFSEDFGSFQREVPGAMYFLGVSNPEKGTVGFPHTPNYVADDDAIMVGAHAMLAALLALMEAE